ncbi:MAG: hypothetical protein LKF36_10780 [Lactobacillus sp.]|jgi:hypothetical protein|nr:hypothetical protein [Lactobacillus sp.]
MKKIYVASYFYFKQKIHYYQVIGRSVPLALLVVGGGLIAAFLLGLLLGRGVRANQGLQIATNLGIAGMAITLSSISNAYTNLEKAQDKKFAYMYRFSNLAFILTKEATVGAALNGYTVGLSYGFLITAMPYNFIGNTVIFLGTLLVSLYLKACTLLAFKALSRRIGATVTEMLTLGISYLVIGVFVLQRFHFNGLAFAIVAGVLLLAVVVVVGFTTKLLAKSGYFLAFQ